MEFTNLLRFFRYIKNGKGQEPNTAGCLHRWIKRGAIKRKSQVDDKVKTLLIYLCEKCGSVTAEEVN